MKYQHEHSANLNFNHILVLLKRVDFPQLCYAIYSGKLEAKQCLDLKTNHGNSLPPTKCSA